MHYGVPLSPLVKIAMATAISPMRGLAIIAAGINEKADGATDRGDALGRVRLLDANVKSVRGHRAGHCQSGVTSGHPDCHRPA